MAVPFCAWVLSVLALLAARGLGGGFWATNLLYGLVLVVAPLVLTRNAPQPDPLGLRLRPVRLPLLVFAGLAVLTLPAFVWWRGLPAEAPGWGRVLGVGAIQLVGVALPEEFFFRGYLQGAWARARTRTIGVLGVRVGWEWPAATAAFALTHVVNFGARGLWTFLPGLLFGWAYARTGTIWAPVLYHGACNAVAFWLSGS